MDDWDYAYDFELICQNCGKRFGVHAGYACDVADTGLVGGPKGFWPASGPLTPVKYQNPPQKDEPGYIPVAPATSALCGFTKNDWLCTRESKHTGIHVAHGEGVMLYHWGDAPKPKNGKIKRPRKETDKYGNYSILLHEPQLVPGDAGFIKQAGKKKKLCRSKLEHGALYCTRHPNHSGPHVGHGIWGNMIASWYSEVEQICLDLL